MTSKLRKHGELTAQQLVAIEFLIVKRGSNMTYGEIAEVAGVSVKTLERWRKFPDFQNELRRRALETMGEALPQVLKTLTGKALEGNNKSIELFLKALGILKGEYDINTRPGYRKTLMSYYGKNLQHHNILAHFSTSTLCPSIHVSLSKNTCFPIPFTHYQITKKSRINK